MPHIFTYSVQVKAVGNTLKQVETANTSLQYYSTTYWRHYFANKLISSLTTLV